MSIESRAYARAGFLGNPSDGYFGKTISITIEEFAAHVSIEQSDQLRIIVGEPEATSYCNIEDLSRQLSLYGYYGAERLLKAAIKKFRDYCVSGEIKLDDRNFMIRLRSSIPRQVGLGGSSAIVTAAMRCLMQFYSVDIPLEKLPSLILSAEKDELGINAGLQDRVIQVYGGCLYMDFDRSLIEQNGHGKYERLDSNLLPPLFLAYKSGLGKVSGHALNTVQSGYDRGDAHVIDNLNRIAEIAEQGKKALIGRDYDFIFQLMNENFDRRSRIMNISDGNRQMIETARACGASAKFAGSGGSIVGMYADDGMYRRLAEALGNVGAEVLRPTVVREDIP